MQQTFCTCIWLSLSAELETEADIFLDKCSAADLQSQLQHSTRLSQTVVAAPAFVAIYYAHIQTGALEVYIKCTEPCSGPRPRGGAREV